MTHQNPTRESVPTPDQINGLDVLAVVRVPDAPGYAAGRHVVTVADDNGLHILWTITPETVRECLGCGWRDGHHPGDHPHLITTQTRWWAEQGHYGIASYGRALDLMTERAKGMLG